MFIIIQKYNGECKKGLTTFTPYNIVGYYDEV